MIEIPGLDFLLDNQNRYLYISIKLFLYITLKLTIEGINPYSD